MAGLRFGPKWENDLAIRATFRGTQSDAPVEAREPLYQVGALTVGQESSTSIQYSTSSYLLFTTDHSAESTKFSTSNQFQIKEFGSHPT